MSGVGAPLGGLTGATPLGGAAPLGGAVKPGPGTVEFRAGPVEEPIWGEGFSRPLS